MIQVSLTGYLFYRCYSRILLLPVKRVRIEP